LWPEPASPHPSISMVNGPLAASPREYFGSPKANSSSKVDVGLVKTSVSSLEFCAGLAPSVGVGPLACEMNQVCVPFLWTRMRLLSEGNLGLKPLDDSIMTMPLQPGWARTFDSSRPLTPMS